jgi:hypothetical protein
MTRERTSLNEAMENMKNAAEAMKQLGLSLEKAGYGKVDLAALKQMETVANNSIYGKFSVNDIIQAGIDAKPFWEKGAKRKEPDTRYNVPKEEPKVSDEKVEETIEATEIYRRAKELIFKHQCKQVGYGLDKYPNPLSADVWDILETIDHIIDESIDKLHYLVMLRIHLERQGKKEIEAFREDNLDAHKYSIEALKTLYTEDHERMEKITAELENASNGKVYVDTHYPSKPVSINSVRKSNGFEPIEEYCKADIEATHQYINKHIDSKSFEELTPDDLRIRRVVKATTVIDNEIKIGDETIEALEDGKVLINGERIFDIKKISTIQHMEHALNILTRSLIKVAGGNPSIHTTKKKDGEV